MKFNKIAGVVLAVMAMSVSQFSLAEAPSRYIWDSELEQLPKQQREFVEDVVTAFRGSDTELGKSRLHSDVLRNTECANNFLKIFEMSTIKEKYAIKVQAGKRPNSLYFSIRHQNAGEDAKRDFMKFKHVVEENGRLVIYVNSCIAKQG